MASNPDPVRRRGKRPHDEMHVTSAKAGPDLRCAPGWRRFASGFAEHRKIAETQRQTASRTSPHHIIGRCCANPIAAVVPVAHRQPHAFPIGPTQPPQLPPWKVFQRGPTQAQPPPSRRGPHRKTFTKSARRLISETRQKRMHGKTFGGSRAARPASSSCGALRIRRDRRLDLDQAGVSVVAKLHPVSGGSFGVP